MPQSLPVLLDHLRAHGYRITAQRQIVLETLLARQGEHHHFSCEEVTQAVNARGMPLDGTTVYRILQWLKEANVIAQTDVGAGHDVYSLVGEHPHHHLICLHCRRVLDVGDDLFAPLRAALQERYGFQARIEHFAIFGVCAACSATPPPDPAEASGKR
ncbi:MAG: transcriptional repressor [Anaerolineae bacterium]|nr:transcriptional repressor [Anaerolineae bacterium]